MRTNPFKFSVLAAALVTCGVIVSAGTGSDPMLDKVADYRQWTRVTHEPVPVPGALSPLDQVSIAG